MDNNKKQIWLPLFFAIVMIFGMLVGYNLHKHTTSSNFFSSGKTNSIQEVVSLIQNKYVDKIKIDSISEATINDLLSHLDPHSIYIPQNDVQAINDDLIGNFYGIGVEFQMFEDTVTVISVVKNGPSEKAGVQAGDKIIFVNDTTKIAGVKITTDVIRNLLRGEENSKVNITVIRDQKQQKITITRGSIPVSTIDASYMIEPQTGFIRLNKFGEKTYEEFMEQLEKLQKEGMKNLILDLRGNTGGLLNEAVDIADEFLSNNKLVVYTEGAKSARYEFKCKRDGLFEEGKLIILVDETSASASEVLAGALQDWDRATIIGRRTFGKGLVQQQFSLSNGGALRLTVSRYYTPLGRNIQKSYTNKSKEEYRRDALGIEPHEKYENEDSAHPKPSFKTPSGKTVFGGGGILPDILVTTDSITLTNNIAKIYHTNFLNKVALKLYIQNKNYLSKINSADKFYAEKLPTENDLSLVEKIAKSDSISLQKFSEKEKETLLFSIKKLIAKQMFGNNGYYQLANKTDKVVLKAMEQVKQ
ncbi:MAG TPA: S41 family peptidase [Chitinophagaceae bacterium]|nr:S41 family peptidase [Chitinophagaceae bacterium]MCC6634949.1 S41 family peptidase [Chitinophagaceae bacterium]HMZ47130.1 S41 family peptidase [Chitinophagaceae bacterium]HNE93420.1 S41 family peptidase [Chitinophagaceae bacterium]HNF28925.1 S41 family peptidase [Chitinophagaceae bacterium]